MSRTMFVAAAALFAGLSLVLVLALAQRDSRTQLSVREESFPEYARQIADPISVQRVSKPAADQRASDDAQAANELDWTDCTPPQVPPSIPYSAVGLSPNSAASNSADLNSADYEQHADEDPTSLVQLASGQSPTNGLREPPRFDASRIVSRRTESSLPTPRTIEPPTFSSMDAPPPFPVAPPMLPQNAPGPGISPSPSLGTDPAATPGSGPASSTGSSTGLGVPTVSPSVAAPPKTLPTPSNSPFPPPPADSPSGRPMATLGPPQALQPDSFTSPTSPSPDWASPERASPERALSDRAESAPMPSGAGPTAWPAPPPLNASSRSREPESKNAKEMGKSQSDWSQSRGSPGARQLDGSQNPSLEILKRAPAEVQVGLPATFTAVVRNVGNATAYDVQVLDAVPRGAKLVRTTPEAQSSADGGLVWNLGEMSAGQEAVISMELIPELEGEMGSVASVKFSAQASVRTMSTLPKLSVKQLGPPEILGGDSLTVWIEVTNTGTGTARDVQLEEDVPPLFRHASGARTLGLAVGDLAPGDSQRFNIELTAVEAGQAANVVRAVAENAASSESSLPIEIKAPRLQSQLVGPRIRYLERPALFEAVIENSGTAMAKDLYIVAYLPRGLHFNSANNEGTYLPEQHAIAWNLAELAAGTKAKTEFTLLPVEEGKFVIRMTTDGEGIVAESAEREVQVEGQSELTFEIDDDHDPIETQGVVTYTVLLTNIGTRPDRDIQLAIELPEGAVLDQVNAVMPHQSQGRTVLFSPLSSIGPKERIAAKISLRLGREGTQVLRASVKSALRPVPVIKEESTQAYVDR